jgi:hypothetical protein
MRYVHMIRCKYVLGTRNFGPACEKPRLALLAWLLHLSRHDSMQGNTDGPWRPLSQANGLWSCNILGVSFLIHARIRGLL